LLKKRGDVDKYAEIKTAKRRRFLIPQIAECPRCSDSFDIVWITSFSRFYKAHQSGK
jgi:hypothetical protein